MKSHLQDERVQIKYAPMFREYSVVLVGSSALQGIDFCPWCGAKLPESLRDLWFETLEKLMGESIYDIAFDSNRFGEIPKKFQNEEWWANDDQKLPVGKSCGSVNLNTVQNVAMILAKKANITLKHLNDEMLPRTINLKGDIVIDYDAPNWYMDYEHGVNKEFHENIHELLKYSEECENMLEKNDISNARELLLYMKFASLQLESFFGRMKSDLDRLLFLEELEWPDFIDEEESNSK